ncbi:MAG: alpha-amylase/4-alpha-glucanotransferase domain-containing protein [Candidatus Zixiibacteriota bacterium]
MNKIKLAFGIHNHQPVGNFQSVFQDAFDKSYYPFLQLLEQYSKIRVSIHFSGILLKWIEDNRPEGIDLLKKLVGTRQLEIMTGGFYEPILPVIPDRDKIGQIRKLTRYVQRVIGDIPAGMWLAERVWEPHLPKILKTAGVKYTVLDDAHFRYSGLTDDQLHGYYITEEEGATVALFPISRHLRYTIPFRPIEETIDHLHALSGRDGDPVAIYADDGEKFGVWPGTYKSCYTEKWIERFFAALSDSSDWIEMLHFREILDNTPPLGRVYLPTASYTEMNEWALPAQAIIKYDEFADKLKKANLSEEYGVFVRGGFWRNFLAKYPETNNMHKKMLRVSQKIADLRSQTKEPTQEINEAEDLLWRGQCNCPYWHGVFGGMYLQHIRAAVYQNLIMAEKKIDSVTRKRPHWTQSSTYDFDSDGMDELVVDSSGLNFYFKPSSGATLFELDYKPANVNVIDTVTRQQEGYHHKIKTAQTNNAKGETASIHDMISSKEEGLDKLLSYDWYRRGCFIDHFFGSSFDPESFWTASYPEEGDFVNQPYSFEHSVVSSDSVVTFRRDGKVWVDGRHAPVTIEKEFVILSERPEVKVSYHLVNRDNSAASLNFGIEFNFGFPNLTSHNVSYTLDGKIPAKFRRTDKTSSVDGISQFGLHNGDDNFKLDIFIQKKATLWRMPIYSVSLSEEGFEKVQQGICMLPSWQLRLEPDECWELEMIVKFKELDPKDAARVATVSLARA